MKRILLWLLPLIFVLSGQVQAQMPEIRVLALFKNKALFEIDGNRRLLIKDQRSDEGILLVSSNGLRAVVEYEGEQHSLTPKMRIGGSYRVARSQEFRIVRDNSGHFRTAGTINGLPVPFLVDTGATSVAMSEVQARKLGIDYEVAGQMISTRTASGIAPAYLITLKQVSVGSIKKSNVRGIVVKGNSPAEVLLGMSFLNGLEMQNSGNILLLKRKH